MSINEIYRPFEAQAKFYDLFYASKPYQSEASNLSKLIHCYNKSPNSLLSIGCGTGRYEQEFTKLGFNVTAIDRSQSMLKIARKRLEKESQENKINFLCGDAEELELDDKFDVVMFLFCVINYIDHQDRFLKVLRNCTRHLKDGGLLIFDTWHGPAIEKNPPETKERSFPFNNGEILRKVAPISSNKSNSFVLRYTFTELDQNKKLLSNWSEVHCVRPFYPDEIRSGFRDLGLTEVHASQWPEITPLSDDSWNALWIARKEDQ